MMHSIFNLSTRLLMAALAAPITHMASSAARPAFAGGEARPSFRDDRRWTPSTVTPAAPVLGNDDDARAASTPAAATNRTCGAPTFDVKASLGARVAVRINAPCLAGKTVAWTYGDVAQSGVLDATGMLEVVIDAFAEPGAVATFRIDGDQSHAIPVAADDLDRVSKFALIWSAPVDLELHTFMNGARPGEPGHVWSGAPSTLAEAQSSLSSGARSAGFLSTRATVGDHGRRMQVVTLLHRAAGETGFVTLAIDHATRGTNPHGAKCGSGAHAEVAATLIELHPGQRSIRREVVLEAAPCGTTLELARRLGSAGLPQLRPRRP